MATEARLSIPMRRIAGIVAIFSVFLAGSALLGHHSLSAVFDTTTKVTLTGTLTKIDWRNPHIELSLDAMGDGGRIEAWVLQGAPPFFFRDRSISKSRFENALGQTVTVEAHRARNGTRLGALLKVTFPDGSSVIVVPNA